MQTAVRWLAEAISKLGYVSTDILEQAKEMEKQQMIDVGKKFANYNGIDIEDIEQYYNETYGSKGSDEN